MHSQSSVAAAGLAHGLVLFEHVLSASKIDRPANERGGQPKYSFYLPDMLSLEEYVEI